MREELSHQINEKKAEKKKQEDLDLYYFNLANQRAQLE